MSDGQRAVGKGSGIRLLYVPNEQDDFRQIGLRRPLSNMLSACLLDAISVFSLKARLQTTSGSAETQRDELIRRVADFQPTHVLMQHLGGTGLQSRHFAHMRSKASFKLIYHEADPYLAPLHPLPREAAAAGKAADVVFTVGAGKFRGAFIRGGARDVRWEPSPFDPERYAWPSLDASAPFDVVIVANRNRPRWRGLPGWRGRIQFVESMQQEFGDRLAIFGRGWGGPSARGPIAFHEQTLAIASGKISANWDHFPHEPKYFSNRLPISLAAGGMHATTWHPGYDEIFGDESSKFLITSDDPSTLIEAIRERLAGRNSEEWAEASAEGRRFAWQHFRQDEQLVRFLNFDEVHVDPEAARGSWDLSAPYTQEM